MFSTSYNRYNSKTQPIKKQDTSSGYVNPTNRRCVILQITGDGSCTVNLG